MNESLTEREREVARLVAQGITNAEIAEALVIEESTVASHVHKILGKLGVRRRVDIARVYEPHTDEKDQQNCG